MALLTNQTSNGSGTGVEHTSSTVAHVTGTFDGATVSLEVSLDNSTWVKPDNIKGCGQTGSPAAILINHVGTYYLRASVSNAQGSTDITVKTTQSS